jgi:4-amino-4-deoxy-L-arabinose transferase-like glycosyltransferase
VNRLFYSIVAAIVTTMVVLQVTSVAQESQTYDEAVYIAAGYSYWQTGDFRLNTEHPPLAKFLVAAPLLPFHLNLPVNGATWQHADEYAFGERFLYHNRLSPDTILLVSRCTTIALTLLFALILTIWVERRAGRLAAVVALTLFAFDPNILAHGRYATNDLCLALFFFLAVVCWNRAVRSGRLVDYAVAGLMVALAVCTKLSGFLVLPALAVLCLVRRPDTKVLARGCAMATLTAVVAMEVVYHGALYHYAEVIDAWRAQAAGGHLAYAFGSTFKHGQWYFYPAVAAVKTPVGVFVALAVTALAILGRRRIAADSYVVLVAAAIYAIGCIVSPIDLGIRILLPIYPLLYAFIALNLPERRLKAALIICTAIVVVESATIYPYYLAYFNAFLGGPTQGPRYLLDSNIDWGQDTKRLKVYLQTRGARGACTAYFGLAYPFYYGIVQLPWPGYVNPSNEGSLNCLVAVSATWLYGGPEIAGPTWGWLRSQTPGARIGYSIYVYDFRKGRIPRSAVKALTPRP